MPAPVFYRRRRSPAAVAVAVVALAAVAAVLLIWGAGGSGDRGAPDRESLDTNGANGHDVELLHVHGLGLNPADGALYVATHSGLLRMSGHGEPARVGPGLEDLMGFTVIGPDEFLASGHPDVAGFRAGLPGQLGVMESRDAGGQWDIIGLRGEADLHAIAHVDGRTYAADATTGQIVTSNDLTTFERRSRLAATSLAIDPANIDRLVAASGGEVQISDDGARSWRALTAPPLEHLAWDPVVGLWGISSDGSTFRRDAATGSWEELDPLPGVPQAVLTDNGTMYAAIDAVDGSTEIHVRTTGSWTRRYRSR